MPRTTTAAGVAAAALVIALGLAGPAVGATSPSPAEGHAQHGGHSDDEEHGTESSAPEDHTDHGAEDAAPDDAGHDGHDGAPDPVADQTRVSVLGGFGAVNAAVVGSAFLLRRRERRTARPATRARTERGSHR